MKKRKSDSIIFHKIVTITATSLLEFLAHFSFRFRRRIQNDDAAGDLVEMSDMFSRTLIETSRSPVLSFCCLLG